jgi:hypothetical protein
MEYLLGGCYHVIVCLLVHLPMDLSDCKVILVCVFEAALLNFQAYILPCSLLLHAICVLYQIWPFILLNAISGLYSI